MNEITLTAIPYQLKWFNTPQHWEIDSEGGLTILASENTDWFVDPASNIGKNDSPCSVFSPSDANFLLSAKVSVEFKSMFDAGGLFIYNRDNLWAKVCFEYSQQLDPTIVSVVTQGLSDDCLSEQINGNQIYLRLAHTPIITTFHYSRDGQYWHLVRYFTLGQLDTIKVGFLSQSPTGHSCRVRFSEIDYSTKMLSNYRNGE